MSRPVIGFIQNLSQVLPCIGFLHFGDFLRGPCAYNRSAAVAALWPQVDNMVGDLYHVQLMLDHHHCTAGIGQALVAFSGLRG